MSIAAARGMPGIRANRALAVQEQQVKLQQQQEQSTRIGAALGESQKIIQSLIDSHIARGGDPNDVALQNTIRPHIESGMKTAQMAMEANPGINYLGQFTGGVQASMATPTLAQIRAQEQAQALSEAEGALNVADVTADRVDAAKDREAKDLADRNMQFGESTQVWGFNAATGETASLFRKSDGGLYRDKAGTIPADGFGETKVSVEAGSIDEIATGSPPTKTNLTKIQDALVKTVATRDTIASVRRKWRPEFSTKIKQLEVWFKKTIEGTGLVDISPEDKQLIADYTSWKSDTFSLLNQRVRDLSGAAVTEGEAKRLLAEIAGVENSPTEFKALLDAFDARMEMIESRAKWMLQNDNTIMNSGDKDNPLFAPIVDGEVVTMDVYKDKLRAKTKEFIAANVPIAEAAKQARAFFENGGN